MRLRSLIFWLAAIFASTLALPPAACAVTTPTEAAAIAAANKDHTAYTLPPDKLAKSEKLYHLFAPLNFAQPIWGIVCLFLLLQLGIVARMRDVSLKVSRNRWAQGFTFFFLFLLSITLLTLPLEAWAVSVERNYGLSVQHWGSWIGDQAKSFAMGLVFGGLGVMLFFWLVRKFPRRWWLVIWFPVMAFVLVNVSIKPYVIDPMFDKFEPLSQSHPELVQQLEKVVARGQGINIPPERMFLMKASEKTTTLNAYVTGFGASKRVVVWDTSIAKGTPDEILFIFGHEMGHYVLGHIVSGMIFAFGMILISFFIGFHLFQFLLRRLGSKWGIPSQNDWGALVVFVLVVSVIVFFSTPIDNMFSRSKEHAADVYGQEVVHGIVTDPQATGQAAFQLLGENSFSYPYPWPLYSFWIGTHPPTWFRAAFAKHYDPWAPDEEPKYFKK